MKDSTGKASHRLISLSKAKQHLPYESIQSVRDLEDRTPCQSDFTSTLGIGRLMTNDEFSQFKICWDTLKAEKFGEAMTLRDYLCFYNALDVILLAEAHLSFRNLLFEQYQLSPDWYPTLPSFCYAAFLRMLQLSENLIK